MSQTEEITSVDMSGGMQALCHSLGNACHKYEMGTNEGLFIVLVCLFAGYSGGCSIVKTIRGWVRTKPTNTIFHAFYLLSLPISLSIGMQAASVAGVISPFMSMSASLGLIVGISKTMNVKVSGNDGRKLSNKDTGPMVKVLAWSHFRKTVVWIDDFETTCEELIAKLAINLQVHPEDIRIEDGAGSYVDDVNLQYPLWKLRKGNALGVSTSFFGFTEFSLYISVYDEYSSPVLRREREEALARLKEEEKKRINKERKKQEKRLRKRQELESPTKRRRVFTTKWIKKRFVPKGDAADSGKTQGNADDEEDEAEEDELPTYDYLAAERRKRLEALEARFKEGHELDEKELKKMEYLKSYDMRKKVGNTDAFPRQETVEEFVQMIMADESMNIYGIPDSLENSIYKLVLSKMLATLYKLMHKAITGVGLLGHHLELDIEEGIKGYVVNKPPIDVEAVQSLVEILLQEKAVNLTWVADSVEKQIYTNVIVVGFGVMQTFLDSFCVDFCGHRLEAKFKPNGIGYIKKEERMEDFKGFLQTHVDHDVLNDFIDFTMATSGAEDNWVPDQLEKAVFKGIFTLVLYVFKEISGEVVINLLGDNFRMRLVPGDPEVSELDLEKKAEEQRKVFLEDQQSSVDNVKLLLATTCGIAVGGLFF